MTSQNTPDVSTDDTTAGGTPVKRSRRATRSVAAPAAVTTQEPVAAEAAPRASTSQPAAPFSAPEEPAAAEAATSSADEPTAAPQASSSSADEPAPRSPRRRATRTRKAAPAPEPATLEDSADAVDEAATPDATPTPDDAPEEVVVEESVEPRAADERERAAVPTQAPRLATTAVLFQAPDLSVVRPRRRRATATAGSPEEISQATVRREAGDELEAGEPELPVAQAAVEVAEEQQAASARPRRRRGGRGRATRDEDSALDVTIEASQPQESLPEPELESEPDEVEETDEHEDDADWGAEEAGASVARRRRRRGGRGRRGRGEGAAEPAAESAVPGVSADDTASADADADDEAEDGPDEGQGGGTHRRRRRRRGSRAESTETEPRRRDEVTALRGSTRLEAKRQRRREGRDAGRRRQIITEAEFLARRESVDRVMAVREAGGRTQIAVLEDGVLVEHYVSDQEAASMVGNVYLGRVQNVLPSMEAAFVDVGKGRNAVLYAGEVNWDAAGLEGGQPRRIEQALKSGDPVLVQVTKDPIGHKGARLTSQVTLAGRYLVYVPGGGMTGISRKLPDVERNRLKKILRDIVPDSAGVIVRTAAEGASEEELRADIARLTGQWDAIEAKAAHAAAPALLQGEPDMAIRVVRDIFNDDFGTLVVQGDEAWSTISTYVDELAPDLAARVSKWTGNLDVFTVHRVDEQLAKGMDRKVWLPSGGSLVIDRTEAMTVIDVNTGKFTGVGGTLEETVTRNNLEAAEEIVGQLRLRDIGGIIVIDFIDMVLESNRDLVLRRLVECLGRDRTKHQVAEVTSLGLVQMTRKRVGQGLVEAFSETCEHCHGRGFIVHAEPIDRTNGRSEAGGQMPPVEAAGKRSRRKRATEPSAVPVAVPVAPEAREAVKATLATIAAAAAHAHEHDQDLAPADESRADEATGHEAGADAATADVATADVATADVATADAVSADVARADEATADVRPADVPAAEAPTPDVPAAEVPAADVPAADGPVADVPVTDVPAADVPATAEATSNSPHQPRVLDVLAELAARMPVGGRHVPDGPVDATPVGDDGEAPALDLVPVDPAVFEWTAPQEAGEAVDEG